MKIAIMQPYFLPYIGYFQLMSDVDMFIVYDNIKYTKKGWINRNRILLNGKDYLFTIPIASASDYSNVMEREVSKSFDRAKLLNQFKGAYARSPQFGSVFPWLSELVNESETNLFGYIFRSLLKVHSRLGLDTKVIRSSSLSVDPALSGQDRVIATCHAVGATVYVNPIGGLDLYDREQFKAHGIELRFLQSGPVRYAQFEGEFVPSLSIVDVMMFNPATSVQALVRNAYGLV